VHKSFVITAAPPDDRPTVTTVITGRRPRQLGSRPHRRGGRGRTQTLVLEAPAEQRANVTAGRVLSLFRVGSDHLGLAVYGHGSSEWVELTGLVEHLLGEWHSHTQQAIEVILTLPGGVVSP
jgi:hypothetical protein